MAPGRLAIASVLICVLLYADRIGIGIQAQAEVKGTVTDTGGAAIVNASVAFAGKGQGVTVKTDSSGTYRVLLEPGTYGVSVRASGFYEMRRASFTLQDGDEAKFSFELLAAAISDPVFRAGHEYSQAQNLVHHDPFNYQEDSLNAIRDGLQPLVLFGHREERRRSVMYTGIVRDGRPLPVVYTYDLLTVKSQELTYFREGGSVKGAGDVVYEDSKGIKRGSKIEISFRNGNPEVKLQ